MFGSIHLIGSSMNHGKCLALLDLESVEPGGEGVSKLERILVSQTHDSMSKFFCFPESEPWAINDTDLSAIGVVHNQCLGLLVWANKTCGDVSS